MPLHEHERRIRGQHRKQRRHDDEWSPTERPGHEKGEDACPYESHSGRRVAERQQDCVAERLTDTLPVEADQAEEVHAGQGQHEEDGDLAGPQQHASDRRCRRERK